MTRLPILRFSFMNTILHENTKPLYLPILGMTLFRSTKTPLRLEYGDVGNEQVFAPIKTLCTQTERHFK